jgi:hypothetical protein
MQQKEEQWSNYAETMSHQAQPRIFTLWLCLRAQQPPLPLQSSLLQQESCLGAATVTGGKMKTLQGHTDRIMQ